MKNLILAFIAVSAVACGSTSQMSLSVKKPAPVTLPASIQSVAVINRSEAGDATKTLNAIHNVLSLQTGDLQSAGAQASVQGLSDELLKNDRFKEVKKVTDIKLTSFGSGVFPSALSWDSVEKICIQTGTNALFSLELFDTESKVGYGSTPVNVNVPGGTLQTVNHQVSMSTNLRTGWRIYDPSSRTILDEYVLGTNIVLEGSGINPAVALSGLSGRKEAVKDAGNKAGAAYAARIIPYWIRVSREYFVRGDDNFKTAQRKAQSGNWDGAGEIWKNETNSTDRTLAGRACYNMAIIAEINGDLDGAIQWAQKSYEDYKITLALNYVNILRYRKNQENILKEQAVTYNQ